MSSVKPPPIYQPIITDETGVAALPWVLFFNNIFTGDTGTNWTPQFTNLTVVGAAPTITGRYYKLSQALSFFRVKIVPGTNTSSTAGTTYINNFPLTMSADGVSFAVSGLLGGGTGMCDQASNLIYPPGWSAVTVPLTILGLVEAQ
jgi:hypothetical protein